VIVVGTDGSSSAGVAVETALELARARDEEVVFVTAWQELRGDFGLPYERLISPDSAEIEREWATKTAEEAAAGARAAGVRAEAVVRHGKPAAEICAVARARGARLVVVGSSGWGLVEGFLIGSVSRWVLRHAECPVLVAQGHGGEPAQ
jgi:nucleotide-binding universal stress UspA family protein